jgi:hypothetical protein
LAVASAWAAVLVCVVVLVCAAVLAGVVRIRLTRKAHDRRMRHDGGPRAESGQARDAIATRLLRRVTEPYHELLTSPPVASL